MFFCLLTKQGQTLSKLQPIGSEILTIFGHFLAILEDFLTEMESNE